MTVAPYLPVPDSTEDARQKHHEHPKSWCCYFQRAAANVQTRVKQAARSRGPELLWFGW